MSSPDSERRRINAACGVEKADLVIKNAAVLNVYTERFEQQDIAVCDGIIVGVGSYSGEQEIDAAGKFAVPGFIDGHVHLESSLISPAQYCRAVLPHGTAAVIADPHEITNVLGREGFCYMQQAARELPLDIFWMVPSCVPASPFDESGAVITAADVAELLQGPRVLGLAEMMNYPGVLSADAEVLAKIAHAREQGKLVDGHAPLLGGRELNAYIMSGPAADHECSTADEALEKLAKGQWIMIRQGTAGKNLQALLPLFEAPYYQRCMLATDDKHPDDLLQEGHIDHILRLAIAQGADPVRAFKMASYNAACYFRLDRRGALSPGCYADIVLLDDVESVAINSVYKRGQRVDSDLSAAADKATDYDRLVRDSIHIPELSTYHFKLRKPQEKLIGLIPGQVLTADAGWASAPDAAADICKLAVIERHKASGHMGLAFLKGYGLQRGAIATSVAHDSHNIIVAGMDDSDMLLAVQRLQQLQGGMVIAAEGRILAELALPIAGLMCDMPAAYAAEQLAVLHEAAHELGVSADIDPFMPLSFVSLSVIPALRLSTLGVVDVNKFCLLQ